MNMSHKLLFSIGLLFTVVSSTFSHENWKPRLVVCTDIAPADVEPDDMQSMVRLMAYADLFEIEALITSVGWNCDPIPLSGHSICNASSRPTARTSVT